VAISQMENIKYSKLLGKRVLSKSVRSRNEQSSKWSHKWDGGCQINSCIWIYMT